NPTAAPIPLPGSEKHSVIAISPNSRWLVTTGFRDKKACRWDLTAKNPVDTYTDFPGCKDGGLDLAISPDNRWLVMAGENSTCLSELVAPDPARASTILRGHEGKIDTKTVVFSSDFRWLVTTNNLLYDAKDNVTCLWDLTSNNPDE